MWLRALSVPVLLAVVIGAAVSAMCTGIITPRLWLGSALCWAFVPAVQALIGIAFLRPSRVSIPAFLEALFTTYRPWALWYLAVAGGVLAWPRLWALAIELSAAVPLVLTMRLLVSLCTDVLGFDRRTAIRRVAAHQVATVAVVACTQLGSLVPRTMGLLRP